MSVSPRLRPVTDGAWTLDPALGPDTLAVLGAMMSRAPDLGERLERLMAQVEADAVAEGRAVAAWDASCPPERIQKFLRDNLAGYGHASIGSMAQGVFLYLAGFGWPAAWLLLDTPLFDGQEVSTRAVAAGRIPGAEGPESVCRFAPPGLQELHAAWMTHYTAMAAMAQGGGWKFDDARLFLPGTTPTGVVWTQDARAIARHLDHLRSLGGVGAQAAELAYAALGAAAPLTTASIGHRPRAAQRSWIVRPVSARVSERPEDGVSVMLADGPVSPAIWEGLVRMAGGRENTRSHLDRLWTQAPRIRLRLRTTVAVARDWHRHRPVMPWTMRVVTDASNQITFAPWALAGERASEALVRATTTAWERSGGRTATTATGAPAPGAWDALHALPFGAVVELECVGTLPDVLYALELRATVQGANAEYRAQAESGLHQLARLLPEHVRTELRIPDAITRAGQPDAHTV